MVKRDRDGDIQMVGAKVDRDQDRKENLCFKCEKNIGGPPTSRGQYGEDNQSEDSDSQGKREQP